MSRVIDGLKALKALVVGSPRTSAGAIAAIFASGFTAYHDPQKLASVEYWTVVCVAFATLFAADQKAK